MASKQLINAVNGYENYIQRKGVDEQVIDALLKATNIRRKTRVVAYGNLNDMRRITTLKADTNLWISSMKSCG